MLAERAGELALSRRADGGGGRVPDRRHDLDRAGRRRTVERVVPRARSWPTPARSSTRSSTCRPVPSSARRRRARWPAACVGCLKADVAVAVTGAGGPGGQDGREPGTVFIAFDGGGEHRVLAPRVATTSRRSCARRARRRPCGCWSRASRCWSEAAFSALSAPDAAFATYFAGSRARRGAPAAAAARAPPAAPPPPSSPPRPATPWERRVRRDEPERDRPGEPARVHARLHDRAGRRRRRRVEPHHRELHQARPRPAQAEPEDRADHQRRRPGHREQREPDRPERHAARDERDVAARRAGRPASRAAAGRRTRRRCRTSAPARPCRGRCPGPPRRRRGRCPGRSPRRRPAPSPRPARPARASPARPGGGFGAADVRLAAAGRPSSASSASPAAMT